MPVPLGTYLENTAVIYFLVPLFYIVSLRNIVKSIESNRAQNMIDILCVSFSLNKVKEFLVIRILVKCESF